MDAARERADAIIRATLALADPPIRVAYLRDIVLREPIGALALALDHVCTRAEQAEERAREALVSLVDALRGTEPDLRARVQLLREEAAGESLLALERILRHPTSQGPHGSVHPRDPNAEKVPDYGRGRPLTLGERKSLARRPSRDMLERLLNDPHPEVIRRLLVNPGLTEDDVIRLAAKRPCRGDVLAEITQSERWIHRSRVRLAIVLNPSTPVELAAPIVSLLVRQELKLVATSTQIAPSIRALCLEHLDRRPPVEGDADDDPPIQ
jgi:hypothetical protein